MLTNSEKRLLETTMENQIVKHPSGINTRTLNQAVFNGLHTVIPKLNMHHIAGMLSWVHKSYGHTFLVRTPGHSVIL